MTEERGRVVFSKVLGLLPCEVVGRNEANCLVRVCGMDTPMSVKRSAVFELVEGWEIEGGRLIALDEPAVMATCSAQVATDEEVQG